MERVGVEFGGSAGGAVGAAKQTSAAIEQVKHSASGSRASLQGMENDLGRLTRGAVAGSGALRGLGRSVAFASAGFLGGFGLAAAIRGAADELVNQVKVGAQANAVLRSTGGIAGVTAKYMDELAKAQLRKTGIDDEMIKSAEVMLLRFTQVRDVVGQGNNVFTRATATALDLAQALGRDATDAAFALGKALNDPTRGVQALRRVGAAFTAEEAKQIKTLAEHGHVLEAQKAILDALTRSYGGTAKAVADAAPWMRLRETLKNLSATAIRPLLPEIDSISGKVQKWADRLASNSDAQAKLKTNIQNGVAVVKEFAGAANDVAGALGGWKSTLELLLALKVASTLTGWAAAIKTMIGTEAAASGIAGASGATNLLNTRLERLRFLTSRPFQFIVAYEIVKKITGSNADLSNDANAPGVPVFQNGKWVDPVTGIPVQDQAYWNKQFRRNNPGAKPTEGSSAESGSGNAKQQAVSATAASLGPSSGGIYVYGGTGGQVIGSTAGGNVTFVPGYDCSGYVQDVYKRNGIDIPRTSQAQFADPKAIKVGLDQLEPGDAVFFDNGSAHAQPDHVGIVVSGKGASATMIDYFHSGQKAETIKVSDKGLPFMGGRRWIKTGGATGGGKTGAEPPKSGGSTSTASANALPARIRQAISAADVGAASAALTATKADDKAAVAAQRAALEEEIAWLNAKLATKLGPEKKITYEDLLTGALTSLKGLDPGKKAGSTGISTVIGMRAQITAALRDLPAGLDTVGLQAVSKLQALREHLKVGLSSKDLATTRASIKRWEGVLSTAITEAGKRAAAAAQEASRLWQRGWTNDVAKVLRDFDENVSKPQLDQFDRETTSHLKLLQAKLSDQLKAFDTETKKGLAALAAPAETPEEAALRAFTEGRAADQRAKQKTDLDQQIKDLQDQLGALGVTTSDGGGALIDIATGTRTALAATSSSVVDQQKQLTQQLLSLQEQRHQLELDDQERALQAAADASRKAADKVAQDAQDAYQQQRDDARQALQDKEADAEDSWTRLRDGQKTALQDRLNDQATALSQDLDDWGIWLDTKQKTYQAFLDWLAGKGLSTSGVTNPGGSGTGSGNAPAGAIPRAILGKAIPFQGGGRVPGPRYGPEDTVMSRLSGGEHVTDRRLTAAMEDFFFNGGGSSFQVVAGDVYLDGQKVGKHIARGVTDEQDRQIGYTIQRG